MEENYWLKRARVSRRRLLGSAGAASAAALLAACGGSSKSNSTSSNGGAPAAGASAKAGTAASAAGAKPVRGGTMTVGLANDIANLDPLKSTLYVDRLVHYQMYDSLIRTNKDLKLLPGLALSWETGDPTSIVFKLRPGVKFHDGSDFTGEAVKFNMERILQAKSSPRQSEVFGLQQVEVVDPQTVKFHLKQPFAPLLAQLVDRAGMMLSPGAIQKLGDELTRNPQGAGTGAFKFVEYKKDDHINLTRNEAYWEKDAAGGALPYLDKLIYRPIVDETQRLNSLRTGEIDFADGIPAKDVESVKKDPALIYSSIASLGFGGVELNSSAEPFKDVRVRQALAWSIDRQQIADSVFYKIPPVSNGPIAPPQFPYDPSYKPFTRDVNKAKALLQQAGKPAVSFTLLITAGSPTEQQYAELIKDQAKDAGFTVNLESHDFPTLNAMTIKHNFQSASTGWSGRLDPDGNTYGQFHTGGGFNDGQYSNPAMDKALEDARLTFDEAKRKGLYQQVNKLAAEDAPWLFVVYRTTGQYSSAKVKNFTVVPDGVYRFVDVWKQA